MELIFEIFNPIRWHGDRNELQRASFYNNIERIHFELWPISSRLSRWFVCDSADTARSIELNP